MRASDWAFIFVAVTVAAGLIILYIKITSFLGG